MTRTPDWVRFLNDTGVENIKFEFSPQEKDIGTELQCYITLTDHNSSPKSQRFEFTVTVAKANFEV